MYTNEMAIAKLEEMGMDMNDAYLTIKVLHKMNAQMLDSIKRKYTDNKELLEVINNIEKRFAEFNRVYSECHLACYKSLVGGINYECK